METQGNLQHFLDTSAISNPSLQAVFELTTRKWLSLHLQLRANGDEAKLFNEYYFFLFYSSPGNH